jgi:hypothetical protein
MNTEDLALEHGEYEIIELNGTRLLLFKTGKVYRWSKCGYWKYVPNTKNLNSGYNLIGVGQTDNNNLRLYLRHRLLAYAFLNLDIENTKIVIDHIDGNKLNNNINNLRIVNHQQNCFNRTNAKGYYIMPKNKFKAIIGLNFRTIYLGIYNTEEEARQAYLQAKIIYHPI